MFAKRVLADEPFQLWNELRVAPELEVDVDPLLQRRQPLLVETGSFGARERPVELGQRRPPPQGERLPEQLPGLVRRGRSCTRYTRLEALEVECPFLDADQVAGGLGDDRVVAEQLAQLRDVHLDGRGRGLRGCAAPDLVDQAIASDGLVGVEQEQGEQRPLLRTPELQHAAVLLDLERSEDAEFHRSCGPPSAGL